MSRHAPGQLLIRLRDATGEAALTRIPGARGGSQERHFKQIQIRRVRVREADLDRLQAALEQSGPAAFVEKDYLAEGAAAPNDPSYVTQWYLAKINGSMAWDISKGSGAVVAGAMQAQGSALDNVAVTKVEFYVDGQLNGSSTLAAFSFAWNAATATNGAHTLAVKAYHAAGNTGSASLSVSVSNATLTDTSAPAVAITSPANGDTIRGAVTIKATATGAGAVKLVYFHIDGVLYASGAAAPYNYAWDARKATRGTHTSKATAFDSAGNSASDSIRVKK